MSLFFVNQLLKLISCQFSADRLLLKMEYSSGNVWLILGILMEETGFTFCSLFAIFSSMDFI